MRLRLNHCSRNNRIGFSPTQLSGALERDRSNYFEVNFAGMEPEGPFIMGYPDLGELSLEPGVDEVQVPQSSNRRR